MPAAAGRDVDSVRAIRPSGPIDGAIRVPGSRSIVNRALVCAALADGESFLVGPSESDDTAAMRDGLRALGVSITSESDGWRINGVGGRFPHGAALDVRASGTTARFLTAAATLAAGSSRIDGVARMRERPIVDLVEALRGLGAVAEIEGAGGCPPVEIEGGGLPGGSVEIDASRSSQFVSGILLAAPCAREDVILRFRAGVLVSRAFAELTVDVMRAFGASVELDDAGARVEVASAYQPRRYDVEPDGQSAVYPLAAAAITGGRAELTGIPGHSRQTDLRVLDVLERMGCRVVRKPDAIELFGPPAGALHATEADMNPIPDAVLALAVVALFADGPCRLRNVAHMRIKETDRLAALESEIGRLGARAHVDGEDLVIEPSALHGARIATYDDHRMAMAFALAGLRVPGVEIADPGCVAKTWPDYFEALERLTDG